MALRQVIIGSTDFDMFSFDLKRLEELVESGRHAEVVEFVPQMMPNWLLSARAHVLLSQSAKARGETERAEGEARLAEACIFGLKSTGDGSAEAPYFPIHTSDEYDLLQLLGKNVLTQQQKSQSGHIFDVLNCTDGTELWFNISDLMDAMAKRR